MIPNTKTSLIDNDIITMTEIPWTAMEAIQNIIIISMNGDMFVIIEITLTARYKTTMLKSLEKLGLRL